MTEFFYVYANIWSYTGIDSEDVGNSVWWDTNVRCDKTLSLSPVFTLLPNYTLFYFVLLCWKQWIHSYIKECWLCDINCTNVFLGQSSKAIEIKTKINKWDLIKLTSFGTSLVVQWLRICLPMQETWVWALVREDPTCWGATKPVRHNYWACALEPGSHNYWVCVPQLLKPMPLATRQQEKPP